MMPAAQYPNPRPLKESRMTITNWTAANLPDLTGRIFIVTGATSGLGKATADALARAGAHVVLAVRNRAIGQAVADSIAGDTEVRELDLSSLPSVRAFASTWQGPIDVLINNAGVMQVPEGRTDEGFELQFGTNHLGHFALTNLLLPQIRGRVVTLSSEFHRRAKLNLDDPNWRRRRYNSVQAYKDSKLANLLFARELHRQLSACGSQILSVAAHPGIVRTGLFGHVNGAAGLWLDIGSRIVSHDVDQGILPTLFAATQEIPGGTFVGPNGFRQLHGFPTIVQSSKDGNNAQLGQRLWELSESLTGTRLDCGTPRPALGTATQS
jgi:NAD(P)-dependent dehydrogenase (short-subunit alcohol dehydrogenase family)